MNIEKTGKPDRWSKGFKKKLLCELEELGGDFDRVDVATAFWTIF